MRPESPRERGCLLRLTLEDRTELELPVVERPILVSVHRSGVARIDPDSGLARELFQGRWKPSVPSASAIDPIVLFTFATICAS